MIDENGYAEVETKAQLKPPKNYRCTAPKCCPTCKHFKYVEVRGNPSSHAVGCERPGGQVIYDGDWLDMWEQVCDYWQLSRSEQYIFHESKSND
jgi:hypothetical protein